MADKPGYNAGTIFLQVVPVFRDVQEQAKQHAKDYGKAFGDEAERHGDDAGKKFQTGLDKNKPKLPSVDTTSADRSMDAFERKVRQSAKRAADSLGDVSPSLARLSREFQAISDPKITPELDSKRVIREMRRASAEIRTIAASTDPKIEPRVKLNAKAVYAQLQPLMAAFAAIDGRNIEVDVKLKAGKAAAELGLLRAAMRLAAGDSGDAANAFRSFNFVILAVATLIPGLIPIFGALGGGLLALIPILGAVTAGLGIMVAGFSGIGAAVKGLSDVQKNAAKDSLAASKTMKSASRGVENAERSLARARKSAAQANADAERQVASAKKQASDQIRSALDQERSAQESLNDAKRDARQAEDDLREARKRARDELKQAEDDRAGNALDVRQGLVDVFNATVANNAVQQDGSSTNLDKEVASINLERARLALKEARDEQKRLAAEKKKSDAQGVDGTDTVKNAQDALTAAIERERDARRDLGRASKAVDEARIEGAAQVAEAIRSQQQTQASGAESVADAQRGLTQAQEDYADALYQTGVLGSTSMQNLEDAMNKLGPAGQRFARFIFGLRDEAFALRDAIQEAMLPGVQAGLEAIINRYGPQFQAFAARMGGVLGRLFEAAGKGLGRRPWDEFFATYSKVAPGLLEQFGKTTGNWMGVFARLLTIAAPYAERLSAAMEKLSEKALAYVQSAEGTKKWQSFLDYAFRVGPKVAEFFKQMWRFSAALVRALAPWGEAVMGAIGGLFKLFADMDPNTFGFVVQALLGLVIAFQLAVGAAALLAAGATIFLSPLSKAVFIIAAVVGALIAAYHHFDLVRKIVDSVTGFFKEHIDIITGVVKVFGTLVGAVLIWNAAMKVFRFVTLLAGSAQMFLNGALLANPLTWIALLVIALVAAVVYLWKTNQTFRRIVLKVWDAIKKGAQALWDKLQPVFRGIGRVITWLWKNVVKPYMGFMIKLWTTLAKGYIWTWKNLLWPIFKILAAVVVAIWKVTMKPTFRLIKLGWDALGAIFRYVWRNSIKPIFDAFADRVLPKLRDKFRTVIDAIKSMWEGLKGILAKPIKVIIETILNKGLIGGFNWVARKVGAEEIKEIPMPKGLQGYAKGGVYPGYTPGRDIGYIGISGGEAIMRPEFTRAVGEGWVNDMNAIARTQGIGGLKKRLGGYAGGFKKGGVVWPVPGHQISTYAGHDGVDINRGSGWDDFGDPIVSATGGTVAYVGTGKGYGQAIFVNTPYGTLVYGHTSGTFVRAGQQVSPGTRIGSVGNTGNSSAPHLHFGFPGGTYQAALQLLGGAAYAGMSGTGSAQAVVPSWVSKILGGPVNWLKERVSEKFNAFTDRFGDSPVMKMFAEVPKGLIGAMGDKIKGLASSFKSKAMKLASAVGNFVTGGDTGVKDAVRAVAKSYGWDKGAQWDAIDYIVSRESSWNPNAANPNSSARGLFQKMTSIHGPVESTPTGQAKWGLAYIRGRYGDPLGAKNFWDSHGSYADGGVVPSSAVPDNGTMMYDNGGFLPPGLTTVLNLTGKPEPVFTADQFANMGRGGDGGGFTYAPTFNASDLTANDVAEDLNYEFRRIRRRGKRYGD